MILFGVPESFQRSPFAVVAALVPLAQQTAKSSVYWTKPRNARAPRQSQSQKAKLALAAVANWKELTVDVTSRKDAVRC